MNSTNETFNSQLSLFIPRVDTRSLPKCKEDETDQDYETLVKSFIAEQFHNYNIGSVDRVDLITKMTPEGYPFYIAFIHFAEWYNNFQAKGLQKAVFNPNQKAKMYVSQRSYWIVCENKKPLTEKEVEMKEIIYKQEKELETLKKELEAMKHYEQASPEAKQYARYMQEQVESAACELFETPVQSPVQFDRPPPLKRSVAYVLPEFEEELPSPPMLTRCNTERVGCPTPSQWGDEGWDEEEEEEMPPPVRLTRCNTEKMGEDEEEEDIPAGPAGAQEDIPPPPTLTRCNA